MKSPLGARKGEASGTEQGGAEGIPDAKFAMELWEPRKTAEGACGAGAWEGRWAILENFPSKHGIGTQQRSEPPPQRGRWVRDHQTRMALQCNWDDNPPAEKT